MGLGCLGCGGETGAGRADLRGNVLWTKNGQNEIVMAKEFELRGQAEGEFVTAYVPGLSLPGKCVLAPLHLLPSEAETKAPQVVGGKSVGLL